MGALNNVDLTVDRARAPGSSSDRQLPNIALPVSAGGSSVASVVDESAFEWDKVKRKRGKRNRSSTVNDEVLSNGERNAMIEHVMSEAPFEVERRAAATHEAAQAEIRRKEGEIASVAEADIIKIKNDAENEARRAIETKQMKF